MKIYSTRHGQTDYNANHRILGITDVELNEIGVQQAEKLAEDIKQLGDVDIIISSPMKRAFNTASKVAEVNRLEIVTDERLREWDYGYFEGMNFDTTPDFAVNKREFGVKMGDNGESLLQLAHRVYSVLDDIIKMYHDKNVLIVSHGGICRIIETYFNNLTTEQYSNWFMGNCQVIEYEV